MAFGESFRQSASNIIAQFSTELGKSQVVQRTTTYDASLGEVAADETLHDLYIAFDTIQIGSVILGNKFTKMDPSYLRDKRVAYIAGIDIPIAPSSDDFIIPAGDTKRYRISDVSEDQYSALYTCLVSKVPE